MIPKFLSPNDTIGIVSTARFISPEELQSAKEFLINLGLKVLFGKNLFKKHNQFAGSDEDRIADFQYMIDNKEVKAILCARGGYGSVRIIDRLDFSSFKANPKWIIGFSDVTVFHNHLNQVYDIPTIHAPMPISFSSNTIDSMIYFGQTVIGERSAFSLPVDVKRKGETHGKIVGGNLSIIYSLMGSISQLDTHGKILFIEDVDEMLYHIDRMMMALKRAGMLSNLAGLIVGGMTGMRDNTKEFGFSSDNPYGQTAKEIIWQHVEEYDYPVCFDFPAGHLDDNCPIVMGVAMDVKFGNGEIKIY